MTNEELCVLIQQGIEPEKNLEALFTQNMGIIAKLAYQTGGVEEQEDLRQQAYFGLMNAVERWNPKRGTSFLTYATYWIRQEMIRYLKSNSLIAIPANRSDIKIRIKSFEESIPGAEELALGDILADPRNGIEEEQDRIEQEQLRAVLWETVDELEPSESKVLRMRYQDEQTLRECGERLGLSIESVRRIESRALRKMRGYRVRRKLSPYVQDRIYSISLQGGLGSFKRTGSSATEKAAICLLEERQRQQG